MNSKPITHISKRRIALDLVKYEVMKTIGMDELTYNMRQFEVGIAFLEARYGEDTEVKRNISYSRIFWTWWRNQWLIRDEFLLELFADTKDDDLGPFYYFDQYHSVEKLVELLCLNDTIVDSAISDTIHKIIKEEVRK